MYICIFIIRIYKYNIIRSANLYVKSTCTSSDASNTDLVFVHKHTHAYILKLYKRPLHAPCFETLYE